MKKILLLAAITLAAHVSLHAQLAKNSWMVGGSVALSSTSSDPDPYGHTTNTTITIAPKVGYFFIDRLAAGLSVNGTLNHQHWENTDISPNNYHDNSYGVGPFVRYYFLPTQSKANILLEVSDQYTWLTASYYGSAHPHVNTYGFAAGPSIFLNSSVAVEFTIGYSWSRSGKGFSEPSNNHALATGIGLQVYLPGKHGKGKSK